VKYSFKLTGIGDKTLENAVYEDVNIAGYTENEMADVRVPAEYCVCEFMPDVETLIDKIEEWSNIADYKPDIVIPTGRGIKVTIKRILARTVRWYVIPIKNEQEKFNQSTKKIISELTSHVLIQERRIKLLQGIVADLRKKDV
jgi:hypothetical protein